tara:strand:- start:1022 stop:2455 length:1434 start_codon:yes stop_codon:yes gene_type:complete
VRFEEFEKLMYEKGIYTLAEIARSLDTTPQAVSNWKSRDQVPYHVEAKFVKNTNPTTLTESASISMSNQEDKISLSDILLVLSQQIKIIFLVPFVIVFLTFTYVMFIQKPLFTCEAKILLPSSQSGASGGLAGLASQFGVTVPQGVKQDLSNPSMLPDLLLSRTFAEKILPIKFYSAEFDKKLSLISILSESTESSSKLINDVRIKSRAISNLSSMIEFEKSKTNTFNYIRVTTERPQFSKELLTIIIKKLEELNRFYKNKSVVEKIDFIDNRIKSVKNDLEKQEKELKLFREQNRQISSSPSLQLLQDRLLRNVEIQKDIFLTLKQQLELAKIEEVQEASIFQVLDEPQLPLSPSNKNLIFNIVLAGIFGVGLGVFFAFLREYLNNSDLDERRKLRKVKSFLNKKIKDSFFDRKINGTISFLLLFGLPFYLNHTSDNPVFFGKYSHALLIFNICYVLIFTTSLIFFFSSFQKNKNL